MRISDWSSDVCSSDLFDSPTGKGAFGTVDGKRISLGNARFLSESGIDVSALEQQADELRQDGATAIFIGIDKQAAGILAIADAIKATTAEAIAALRKEGIRVVMLTGDNRTTAEAVGLKLGIEYRQGIGEGKSVSVRVDFGWRCIF